MGVGFEYELDKEGLRVHGYPYDVNQLLEIRLNGRCIWYLTPAQSPWAQVNNSQLEIKWPYGLADRFQGIVRISLVARGHEIASGSFQVGDGNETFRLVNPATGKEQILNKWGRLGETLAMKPVETVDKLLQELQKLVIFVKENAGIDLFATGATLLGTVRGGKIVPGDDDADLSYLSRHNNPTDIVTENFLLERILRESGYDIMRHSNGHLQLYFPAHEYYYDFYIDIFTYFIIFNNFYGTFHVFKQMDEVPVLPLKTKKLNGYDLPVPCNSEALLEAIYGPSWHIPDPSFVFATPPRTARRFHHWLGHIAQDLENWEDLHRAELIGGPGGSADNNEFADYVRLRLKEPVTVIDLGAGLSGDAEALAKDKHHVYAIDYSRPVGLWRRRNPIPGVEAWVLNMYDVRDVAQLAALIGRQDNSVVIYGKNWWETISMQGFQALLPLFRQLVIKNNMILGSIRFYFESIIGADEKYKNLQFYRRIKRERLYDMMGQFGVVPVELERDGARIRYSLALKNSAYEKLAR